MKPGPGELPKSIAFVRDTRAFTDDEGREGQSAFFALQQGEFLFDARRLLIPDNDGERRGRPPNKRAEAAAWLTKYLFAASGHKAPVEDVQEDATQHAITRATLGRAAKDMGVDRKQQERKWWWILPRRAHRNALG